MRLFVAVEIADPIREALAQTIERLRTGIGREGKGVSFVRPKAAHLTMMFLGETEEGRVNDIAGLLEDLRGREPFTITLGGLSAFPGVGRARVVWAGVKSGAEEICSLAESVRGRLAEFAVGNAVKSPFVPHLTLCRFRAPRDLLKLEVFRLMQETELGRLRVMNFVLMRSTLKPEGAVYETIRRFDLEGRGG